METSMTKVILEDLADATKLLTGEMEPRREHMEWLRGRISLYMKAEEHLSSSPEDELLRQFFHRRLEKWRKLLAEAEQEKKEAEQKMETLHRVRGILETRK